MPRMLRSTLGLGLALLACGTTAQPAAGDGLPVPYDSADNVGVAGPDGDVRYSAVGAGADTAVLRIATGSGEIQRSTRLRGEFAIPVVAYDGTRAGSRPAARPWS